MSALAPLYVLTALLLLVVTFGAFLRLGGGRYARNLVARLSRIPTVRRRAVRAYVRDLERTNPEAARALVKVERVSGGRARPGEAALSVLTVAERRAYDELFNDEQPPMNRAQRRRGTRSTQQAAPRARH